MNNETALRGAVALAVISISCAMRHFVRWDGGMMGSLGGEISGFFVGFTPPSLPLDAFLAVFGYTPVTLSLRLSVFLRSPSYSFFPPPLLFSSISLSIYLSLPLSISLSLSPSLSPSFPLSLPFLSLFSSEPLNHALSPPPLSPSLHLSLPLSPSLPLPLSPPLCSSVFKASGELFLLK